MSYDLYDTSRCNGWKQRLAREESQRENFWKNEIARQKKIAARGDDDASSIVSSYVSGNSNTTINTMVLKDKIKNLQWKLEEERLRREQLEQQLASGAGSQPISK